MILILLKRGQGHSAIKMSNNFTYKYKSGAEVTFKSTEDATVTPAVHTMHINAHTVDSDGDAINTANPLQVQISDGTETVIINADGSINVEDVSLQGIMMLMLIALKKIELHLSIMNNVEIEDQDIEV